MNELRNLAIISIALEIAAAKVGKPEGVWRRRVL
jgi:hypothetical protein